MPAERFYTATCLHPNEFISIENQEFHHLAHVMRLKESEIVEVVNGEGFLATAEIQKISKQKALLHILKVYSEPADQQEIIIAQAIPRINRLDTIVEKGTELGMTSLWLFPGELSERKNLTEHQLERLKGIAIAAMKQSGRLYLPKIILKPSLDKWEKLNGTAFFGDLDAKERLSECLSNICKNDILICIGPESGFSKQEIKIFTSLNFKGIKLHKNILRTDTASIVALTIIENTLHQRASTQR